MMGEGELQEVKGSFVESGSDLLSGKCVGLKSLWRGRLVILVLRK